MVVNNRDEERFEMDYGLESLKKHYEWRGKLDTVPKMEVKDREALSLAYTPGVAQPCLEIKKDINKSYELTGRWNTAAVVTDGTAVLGLGDIGPEAGMPVMEGKCVLFKAFGGVNAVPLCVRSKDVDEIVNTVALLAGSFGGINLEDISAPRCFEIERKLKERCDIPVFHDDQHGTAIIVAAALVNALKIVGKELSQVRLAMSGAGAAGTAIFKLLWSMGLRRAVLCDIKGIVYPGRPDLADDPALAELADMTKPEITEGGLAAALKGADVFIGVSAPGLVTQDMVRSMADQPVLFPMANPTPEIMPDLARAAGAAVVGTGRSDFPNQINNVLAFPGVFRGAFDVRASDINEEMKQAAVRALAELVSPEELSPGYIIPAAFDERVAPAVAKAVADAARRTGAARA
jgi:malate dehydrogenase (oxaloacetate-decarboxylating)